MDFSMFSHAPLAAGGDAAGGLGFFLPLIILFGLMYFMMIRPQQKRQKQHKAMIAALAKGDEIITGGGLAGKVTDIKESFIHVEVAEGVQIKLQRASVAQVLPKGTLKSV